ncbi:MAG: hypothetical protein Q9160_004739 [Pyrenula sp. 1 TL-2023]
MVLFQGISVSLISSITGQPLPEYDGLAGQNDNEKNVISKFISYSQGHDFWVEYEAHEPLPPNAKFFFTFSHDQQRIASWDCVGKNGYKGKATFGISSEVQDKNSQPLLRRQVFNFPRKPLEAPDTTGDVLRLEVFRVQARKRLPIDDVPSTNGGRPSLEKTPVSKFLSRNGGYLPKHHPKRYYKYQLLDPIDKPFIAFQFLCSDFDPNSRLSLAPSDIHGSQFNQLPYSCRVASGLSSSLSSIESETVSGVSEFENDIRYQNPCNERSPDNVAHSGSSNDTRKYNSNADAAAPKMALNDQFIRDDLDPKEYREATSPTVVVWPVDKLTKPRGQKNHKALSILIDGQTFKLDQDRILKANAVPTSAPPSIPAIYTDNTTKKIKTGKLDVLKQKVRSSTKERAPFSAKVQCLAEKAKARKAKM